MILIMKQLVYDYNVLLCINILKLYSMLLYTYFLIKANRVKILMVKKGDIVSTTYKSIGSVNRGNETHDINNGITFFIIIIILFIYLTLFLTTFSHCCYFTYIR